MALVDTMIPWEDAQRITLEAARVLPIERVPLTHALARVLAQPVRADMPMPPFRKSIVDGYACRRADLPGPLELVESIPAGAVPERAVEAGQCAKIMTGAMVPDGADCVFIVEHSAYDGDCVRWTGERTDDNIVPPGRDIPEGTVLLEPGHCIGPADMAVLAAMGCVEPEGYRQPRVAVIATGDELVEPHETPKLGQIRNSNGVQLVAQLQAMGLTPTYCGIARDNETVLHDKISRALAAHDVVLLSGGVSMGDFDLVPGILRHNGIDILFDKVAIQPGKPTVFGDSGRAYAFGLPGNPVSTFAIFELLVKPFLYRLMGHHFAPPAIRLPLAEPLTRKQVNRKAFVPVTITPESTVRRIPYYGSAHINALTHADALTAFEVGMTEIAAGTVVDLILIR